MSQPLGQARNRGAVDQRRPQELEGIGQGREGCTVDRVQTGPQALEAARAGGYDLILLDLRMPGMDGVQAARAMRKAGVSTPIAALTADAFEDTRQACLAAGMDEFLTKPLDAGALRAVLARRAGPGFTQPKTRAKLAS